MKSYSATIYILSLVTLCMCVEQCPIPWFVRSQSKIDVLSITNNPSYLVRGNSFTSTVSFKTTGPAIASGTVKTDIYYAGMIVKTYEIPLSSVITSQLPLSQGTYTIANTENIPLTAPVGKYTAKTRIYSNWKILACFVYSTRINAH